MKYRNSTDYLGIHRTQKQPHTCVGTCTAEDIAKLRGKDSVNNAWIINRLKKMN
jgi:hypothetical protein